jgi:hypothetical protein
MREHGRCQFEAKPLFATIELTVSFFMRLTPGTPLTGGTSPFSVSQRNL